MNELCPTCGAYFPCEHIEPIDETLPPIELDESWSRTLSDADYADLIIESYDSL
jgi:hypothetical protein